MALQDDGTFKYLATVYGDPDPTSADDYFIFSVSDGEASATGRVDIRLPTCQEARDHVLAPVVEHLAADEAALAPLLARADGNQLTIDLAIEGLETIATTEAMLFVKGALGLAPGLVGKIVAVSESVADTIRLVKTGRIDSEVKKILSDLNVLNEALGDVSETKKSPIPLLNHIMKIWGVKDLANDRIELSDLKHGLLESRDAAQHELDLMNHYEDEIAELEKDIAEIGQQFPCHTELDALI